MPKSTDLQVAMIGSYVPRRCGIATFTHDVAKAVDGAIATNGSPLSQHVQIVAINDSEDGYAYDEEVTLQIRQHQRQEYRNAAEVLNTSGADVVLLQHEFGLFGGECGSYLLDLLDNLHRPLVTTLHSVLQDPSKEQLDVLSRVCARSDVVVVMADRARHLLTDVYNVPSERIRLIPHGVPDVPLGDTEPFKERFGLAGRPMILTFGLLGPGKGIEVMLDALGKIVPNIPDVAYVVLGVTHPGVVRDSGELYRISLELRAVELGIQKNVLFHNRYVSDDDLKSYLQAADVYATPYPSKEQITSGTLAYALACGKAIVSTPYWHAQELLINGRGRLVEFGDVDGFAGALRELLTDENARTTMQQAAHNFGRSMVWSRVGEQFVSACDQARQHFAQAAPVLFTDRKVLMRMSLPEPRLDHLYTMSDDTGILQHAAFAMPDRRHGYCTDDNARALIVASMAWSLFQCKEVLPYLQNYLSFIHYAQDGQTGRFRNFMSYDRKWMEEDGSDDSQGRAIWALGYVLSHAPTESTANLATALFRRGLGAVESLEFPRSWALSMLGIHYYLRVNPDDDIAHRTLSTLADHLEAVFAGHESDEWPWFEDVVTYDNGRIPQALIIAGHVLERPALRDRGLSVLRWLVTAQTAPEGHLSVIGNDGWMGREGTTAKFDQQPLEAAALIGAFKAAHRTSGDERWLVEMRRCFEWFVGRNDLGVTMIDFKSRGCYDGLEAGGVNENQGAESLLSWLLSLLIMHEMQTGDAPDLA